MATSTKWSFHVGRHLRNTSCRLPCCFRRQQKTNDTCRMSLSFLVAVMLRIKFVHIWEFKMSNFMHLAHLFNAHNHRRLTRDFLMLYFNVCEIFAINLFYFLKFCFNSFSDKLIAFNFLYILLIVYPNIYLNLTRPSICLMGTLMRYIIKYISGGKKHFFQYVGISLNT